MTFTRWFDTLIAEKNINTDLMLEVDGPSGVNMMPLSMVLDAVKAAPTHEQKQIKNTLVMIDFKNGDILHFIRHIAQALAV